MTARSLTHDEPKRLRSSRGDRNGLLQLGWAHYGLLVSLLGILGLAALLLTWGSPF
jgi:hypothetical protein